MDLLKRLSLRNGEDKAPNAMRENYSNERWDCGDD